MAKDFAEAFYHSKKWLWFREIYLSEHPYCERCLKAGHIVPAEHVHHIIWLTPENIHNPYITLNAENAEALCQTCHNQEHHATSEVEEGLMFDEDGNLIKRDGGLGADS